eukprot:gene8444-9346_t
MSFFNKNLNIQGLHSIIPILEIDVTKDEKGRKVQNFLFILSVGIRVGTDGFFQRISKKKRKPKPEKNDSNEEGSFDSISRTSQSSMNSLQAENEDGRNLPIVAINIPLVLKAKLEDDCYNIKRKKKLLKLPRIPCALNILNNFWDNCQQSVKSQNEAGSHSTINLHIVNEVVCGLQTYLNFTISTLLLYNFERDQFNSFFPLTVQPRQQSKETNLKTTSGNSVNNKEEQKWTSFTSTKKKYTRRQFRSTSSVHLKKAKLLKQTKPVKSLAALSSNVSSTGTNEPPPAPRKRGRPRIRPLKIEQPAEKVDVVEKKVNIETTSEIIQSVPGKDGEHDNIENTKETQQRSVNAEMPAVVECETEIKIEKSETIKCEEQAVEDIGNAARSLRPRRSFPSSRLSEHEKEAASKEQSSLAVGATAETMELSQSARSMRETMCAAGDRSELAESSFIPYPLTGDKSLTPVEIYGAEHLLRLFVKLPVLLSQTDLEQEKLNVLVEYLHKFLWFMAERSHIWFSQDNYTESVL